VRSTLILTMILAILAPSALQAQQAQPELPPEARELIAELEEIQQQLAPVQAQALADPEVQDSREALSEVLEATMGQLDPELPSEMERFAHLEARMAAAQAQQDEAAMRSILQEAQRIEQRLQSAQAQALQRPEVAREVERFETRLLTKMAEIDPRTETLVQRMGELSARLHAMVAGS
jgi:hypothetical protein